MKAECGKCATNYPHMPRQCDSRCPETDWLHSDMAKDDFTGNFGGYSTMTGYHLAQCRACLKRWEEDSSG